MGQILNFALIGYGWAGSQHLAALQDVESTASGKARYLHVVTQDQGKARTIRETYGIEADGDVEAVLSDPEIDGVVIATPHSRHQSLALASLSAGKHVYLEKPFALTSADAQALVEAAVDRNLILGLGHNHRLNPNRQEVGQVVRSGELGSITQVEGNISHDRFISAHPPEWRALFNEAPTGGLVHMGAHFIDAYIDMFGEIESVAVFPSGVATGLSFEFAETHAAIFKFKNGIAGFLGSSLATPHYARLQVFGTEGWIEERDEAEVTVQLSGADVKTIRHQIGNTLRGMIELFADAVRGNSPFPITLEQMLHNAAVLEAMSRSLKTGQVEEVQ